MTTLPVGKIPHHEHPIPKGLDHIREHAYYILEEHKQVKVLMGHAGKPAHNGLDLKATMVPASKLSSSAGHKTNNL